MPTGYTPGFGAGGGTGLPPPPPPPPRLNPLLRVINTVVNTITTAINTAVNVAYQQVTGNTPPPPTVQTGGGGQSSTTGTQQQNSSSSSAPSEDEELRMEERRREAEEAERLANLTRRELGRDLQFSESNQFRTLLDFFDGDIELGRVGESLQEAASGFLSYIRASVWERMEEQNVISEQIKELFQTAAGTFSSVIHDLTPEFSTTYDFAATDYKFTQETLDILQSAYLEEFGLMSLSGFDVSRISGINTLHLTTDSDVLAEGLIDYIYRQSEEYNLNLGNLDNVNAKTALILYAEALARRTWRGESSLSASGQVPLSMDLQTELASAQALLQTFAPSYGMDIVEWAQVERGLGATTVAAQFMQQSLAILPYDVRPIELQAEEAEASVRDFLITQIHIYDPSTTTAALNTMNLQSLTNYYQATLSSIYADTQSQLEGIPSYELVQQILAAENTVDIGDDIEAGMIRQTIPTDQYQLALQFDDELRRIYGDFQATQGLDQVFKRTYQPTPDYQLLLSVARFWEPVDWITSTVETVQYIQQGKWNEVAETVVFAVLPFVFKHGDDIARFEAEMAGVAIPSHSDLLARGFDEVSVETLVSGRATMPSLSISETALTRGTPTSVVRASELAGNLSAEVRDSLLMEDASALALRRRYGYDILQNPYYGLPETSGSTFDLFIEGARGDVYVPRPNTSVRNVAQTIINQKSKQFVDVGVINLSLTNIDLNVLEDELTSQWLRREISIHGSEHNIVKEVIIMHGDQIIAIWIPPHS